MITFASFELVLPWTKFYFVFQVIISLGRVSFDDVSLFSWSLWWYLNGESKSTQKIKDKTRWRRNISKKNSTGDEKSAINPSYQTKLSYQNILDLSTKTLIQNFFEIFVKNVIFNPNLEKTTNSNRWGKHFWYPHRLPKLGKHFQRTFLDRFSSEQMIFWVFFIQVIQKKSAPKPNWSLIKMTISSNTIIGHHFIQILVSSKSSTS